MKWTDGLNKLEFFDLRVLRQFNPLPSQSLYKFVKRRVKDHNLIKLKKGVYTTNYFVQHNDILLYRERVANFLKKPSYLSLEYMLSKYSILSENVYVFTSVSTKKTNRYVNDLGTYYYRHIKEEMFTGYVFVNGVYFATKAKSLFDYFYFKKYVLEIDSFRLNLEEFSDLDMNEFLKYSKGDIRMMSIYNLLLQRKKNVY